MKNVLLMILALLSGALHSQVTFIIDSLPANTPSADYLYIAGDLNGWDPGNITYRLAKNQDQKWQITLTSQVEGTQIQFKFTRGSWETVEKGAGGEEIANRTFTFGNGATVHLVIYNWRNDGGNGSTAAENVMIMDEDFEMPQLGRTRKIWLYLPPGYETSEVSYPVLYMHDGQNLFDDQTSFAGEWHVDETLNEFDQEGIHVPIVVGIENGGDFRIDEYSPWVHPYNEMGGEGERYMQFIVETLKPYVDQHYRTLSGRENTAVMGSSMGALISHYGLLAYPDVFSKAGIFSASYWFSDSVWSFTQEAGHHDSTRIYMMCGSGEGQGTINDMAAMQDSLFAIGFTDPEIDLTIIPGGQHNESLWGQEFGNAYRWLFSEYASRIADDHQYQIISFYPNPAGHIISLPIDFPDSCDSMNVFDMLGNQVISKAPFNGKVIDLSGLNAGAYLIVLIHDGKYFQGKIVLE